MPEEPSRIDPAALKQFLAYQEIIRQSLKSKIKCKPTSLEIAHHFVGDFPVYSLTLSQDADARSICCVVYCCYHMCDNMFKALQVW